MLTQRDRFRPSKRAAGKYVIAAAIGAVLTCFAYGVPVQAQQANVHAWPSKVALDSSKRGQVKTATVMLVYEGIRVSAE